MNAQIANRVVEFPHKCAEYFLQGYECVKTTRQCMTQNDKSTFYQPFSMTLVPMQDTMRHWFFGQSHGKVTASARQTPSSGAEEGR